MLPSNQMCSLFCYAGKPACLLQSSLVKSVTEPSISSFAAGLQSFNSRGSLVGEDYLSLLAPNVIHEDT